MSISRYLLVAAAIWPTAALAQTSSDGGGTADPSLERPPYREREPPRQTPIESDRERPRPEYDGRKQQPASFGDVALWVPRVILFPLFVVSEFVIRRPVGALVTIVEKNGVLRAILGGGSPRNYGLVPTGIVDWGLRSGAGLYLWADDPFFRGHSFRLRAVIGGPGYVNVVLKERVPFALREQVSFRGDYELRSDWVFYGLGPRSASDPVRFRAERFEGKLAYETRIWRTSGFAAWLGVRDVSFGGHVDANGDPNLEQAVASGRLSDLPAGYPRGYTLGITGLRAALDTRRRRYADPLPPASDFVSPPGGGIRVAVRAEHAGQLGDTGSRLARQWTAWGGTLGAFSDLDQQQRVVGLVLDVDFVDPIGDRTELPFTELASLGGSRRLRGFLEGRMLDKSSASLELCYRYPIWVWFDGEAHYAVGNVFGRRLDGFELALLHSSFGLGLRSTGSRDHVFELLAAVGTETFEDGAEIESFRLVVGTNSGF